MNRTSIFAPLYNKNFSIILSGQLLSDFGNWMDFIALNTILVYSWKFGPDAVAALFVAIGAPRILLGPLLGVWVDRLPSKLVFVTSDLLRALLVFELYFTSSLWMLLVLVFLKSTVAACFEPARMRAIRNLIKTEILSQAVSLGQISIYLTKILAPSIGGAIVVAKNPSFVFLVETVLFLISAFVLSLLQKENPLSEKVINSEQKNFWKEFKGGFKHLRGNKILVTSVFLMSTTLFLMFLFEGLFALWAIHQHLSEQIYGILLSAVGFGSLLGAFGGGSWDIWRGNPVASMSWSISFSGLLVSFLGIGGVYQLQLPAAVWVVMAFFAGLTAAFSTVPFSYVLQAETPPDLIGRVSGTANSLQNVSVLLAPMTGAYLAKLFSANMVFAGSGLGMIFLGIGMIIYQALKPFNTSIVDSLPENINSNE